jgi:penicillin-binding protein 2
MLIRKDTEPVPTNVVLRERLRWLLVVFGAAFALLLGRMWQLQVLRGERYYQRARENVVNQRLIPSVRGRILDRRGRELAANRPAFNIYIAPREFDDAKLPALVRLLDLDDAGRERLVQRLAIARERNPRIPALVLEDQGRDRAALVAQSRLDFPGVSVRDEPWRHYPNQRLAAHLIGYMNQVTPRELNELDAGDSYEPTELIGRYGLEKQWEHYLRGKKGIERFVVNARGERVEGEGAELIEGPRFVPPVAGHNVILTLDLDLQKLVERAVSQHAAAAVAVVAVNTGRILALVSRPTFDPNIMTGKLTRSEEAAMLADPRKPFLDKTLRQHYPPASTFKFVAAIAALEDGWLDPNAQVTCPGYHQQGNRVFRCTSSHGRVGLYTAIQRSCNVYFWKLAERIGIDRLAEVAFDFGFGAPSGLGMNGDVPGRVPTRAWYEQRETFKIGFTLNSAIGQGDVEVTVLQLAMAYAALANGGALYAPQVVRRVETAGGEVVADYQPVLRRRVHASSETLAKVRLGMWKVVNEVGGTAHDAKSSQVEFAGKTGTAQVRNKRRSNDDQAEGGWKPERDHAWFAGYAPANNPEIAVVVLIEHGGSGGVVAATVARDIIEGYAEVSRASGVDL